MVQINRNLVNLQFKELSGANKIEKSEKVEHKPPTVVEPLTVLKVDGELQVRIERTDKVDGR